MEGEDNTCPAPRCKEQLGHDNVFSKSTLISCMSDHFENGSTSSQNFDQSTIMQHEYCSAKIKAVFEILQTYCLGSTDNVEIHRDAECDKDTASDCEVMEVSQSGMKAVKHTTVYSSSPGEGPVKAIIFSQWTGMLDLVESNLNQFCIQYRRLDGTMTLAARDRAVKDFNSDPEVFLLSLNLLAIISIVAF